MWAQSFDGRLKGEYTKKVEKKKKWWASVKNEMLIISQLKNQSVWKYASWLNL